jgi:Holliday junction DNA helicase RuvA
MVSKLDEYEVGKVKKIYLYKSLILNNKNKISEELFGFNEYEEKEFFLKLLSVNGIGCKTAIGICNNDVSKLKELIANKDEDGLANFKNITSKIARNIVDELELDESYVRNNNNFTDELAKALKTLGYSGKDIEKAVNHVDFNKKDLSDLISDAIKIIASNSCQIQ